VDYSDIKCAKGTTDTGKYRHPVRKFTIRKCKTPLGEVASLISLRVEDMIKAAKKDKVTLTGSAFRSYEEQKRLYDQNCSGGYCDPPTAAPGNSNHEKGLAIDFHGIGRVGSGSTWDWLVKHGKDYGFYNLPSEGWHWSTSGG
jgi:hypothetical protein